MSVAKFRVVGSLDNASRASAGTVTIDRVSGLFTVRPYKRRRTYVLRLSDVATMVCRRIVLAELAEKRRQKAARRKGKKR